MKKKRLLITVIVVALLLSPLAYKLFSDRRADQLGRKRYNQALSEMGPRVIDVCGEHSWPKGSYASLNDMSIEEIKTNIRNNIGPGPYDC